MSILSSCFKSNLLICKQFIISHFLQVIGLKMGEIMKSFGLIVGLIFNTIAFADPVTIDKINYVYVLDSEKSFDFSGGSTHECGSTLYRTTTQTEDIANRKFALALAAYTAGKKVMINTEGCSSNRMKFGWIRILD